MITYEGGRARTVNFADLESEVFEWDGKYFIRLDQRVASCTNPRLNVVELGPDDPGRPWEFYDDDEVTPLDAHFKFTEVAE